MSILTKLQQPIGNQLLAALPDEGYDQLRPHLELIHFKLGETIYEAGSTQDYIYFPTTCIISLLYTMENGASAEIGIVGNEGVVGIALFMGGGTMPSHGVVQHGGEGFRMKAQMLQQEFKSGGALQLLLLRYTQAFVTQISQTAVCNRLHPVEQQLCRWLLLTHDRLQSNEVKMTHELIANMLGTRREGVTIAAGRLQDANLIDYQRGRIRILDRQGLENAVCECYRVVKDEFDRLLY